MAHWESYKLFVLEHKTIWESTLTFLFVFKSNIKIQVAANSYEAEKPELWSLLHLILKDFLR
jgi:hypothetical protein